MSIYDHTRKCMEYIGSRLSDINHAELLHVIPITRDGIIVDIGTYTRIPLYLPHIYFYSIDINDIIDENEINRVYHLYHELMGKYYNNKADIFAIFSRYNINIKYLDIIFSQDNSCRVTAYMPDRYTIIVNSNGYICDIKRG